MAIKKEISEEKIFAYALENAILHNGKAQEGSVLPKLFMEGLDKKDIPKIMPLVKKAVSDANGLDENEQRQQFEKLQSLVKKVEHKDREGIQDLEHAEKGKVVVRFEPSPTGPLHIGHSLVLCLNYLCKKKYDGKLILRISDTNPERTDPEAYKGIEQDANWITGNEVDKVIFQSDNMKTYYKYAEKVIKLRGAYVCTCKAEDFKDLVEMGRACPCRNISIREQLKRWKMMFSEYKEEQAVLRIKTDLKDKNPAVREWPAFRICEHEHPRAGKKYRVWPLMNFAVVVDDIEEGMTHVLKGKDHIVNTDRQKFLFDYLKHKYPEFIHMGKINFDGLHISTRDAAAAIKEGKYTGWDDIRLPFLAAMRKRGIQPGAFMRFAENCGLSEVDKTIPFDEYMQMIYSFNKKFIEQSKRYFFVANPVKISIKNAPRLNVELPLHPQDIKIGVRKFRTEKEFYISEEDYKNIVEGNVYRLMHLFNFEKKGKDFIFHSKEPVPGLKTIMMHWLPCNNIVKAKVLTLYNEYLNGIAEKGIEKLRDGDIVQFERVAFCRLVKKAKDEMEFWWTQK